MTVTLHLSPEIEAELLAQAQASDMTLEEYLLSVVESTVLAQQKEVSAEERAVAFEAWSAGHRATAPLFDYAFSRESIYEDRDH